MRKQTSFALTSSLFALALALPAGVRAEEGHRELGAHVHGHGTLNIAIEDKNLSMELEAPGMDVVGFEHAASNDEQKAKVEAAKALLQKPLGLFVLPAAAGCSVSAADAELESEHDHGDDHDHHAKDEKADAHGHDHDDDAHEHDGHNQFHATYELSCTSPGELTSIGFDYFKQFAGAQGLTVNVVTAKGQSKYEVSREKPTLDLGGIM
jgi:ABC-type nickel/cobalt efflux system permease component RcnA